MAQDAVIAHKALAAYDINSLFPLYFYATATPAHGAAGRAPNLDSKFVLAFGSALGLDFTPDGTGDLGTTFGPEGDVLRFLSRKTMYGSPSSNPSPSCAKTQPF